MDAGVVFSFILCVALGITIVFQALLNSHLGQVTSLNSYSALMSFLVGIPPVLLYFLIESRGLTHGTITAAPWYLYLGGLLGAVYITVIIFTVQRIGAASVLATVVASQVAASIVVDHFAILGVQPRTATAGRIGGTVLIIVGSILVGVF
jgi:bacterial/archaeal transporter family-2 protein